MLGYRGRSNRREFAAGIALIVIAPMVKATVIPGSVGRLFETFPKTVALVLAVLMTTVLCAAMVVWFWGWTVLLTRRARDIGLPGWSGVASLLVLVTLANVLATLVGRGSIGLIVFVGVVIWIAALGLWPGAGQPFFRTRPRPEPAASAA